MELSFFMIVNYFIDILFLGRDWGLIIVILIGLFVVYVFSLVFQYIVIYWGYMFGINIEIDMRKLFFDYL